ncbi:hypothetical protein [Cerasicoccus frondis]|uniref:hypothetical protein n=1 Tax=Cerasicoccus frondis TaxID=490090 RepID=UPI002852777D|nr:hypothetical protein [Cerasicoccus frondis]
MKFALLLGLTASLIALPRFSIAAQVYPLTAKMVTEKLESMELPRIRLEGKRDIQLDYYEAFAIDKPKDESFLMTHRYLPNLEFSLTVFSSSEIPGGVTADSITRYLRKKSEDAVSRKEYFEVIAMPSNDSEPTKIRFLGAKPITIEYAIKREINGEPTRVIVQENWAQLDGETYLLYLEAPEDRFDSFFKQSKSIANSMFFLN